MDGEMVMADQERKTVRVCACPVCRSRSDSAVAEYHRAINRVAVELDERGRRLFTGLLAKRHGRGGIQLLAVITGLDRKTVRRGLREIKQVGRSKSERIRRPGAGRKRAEKKAAVC
jgi:hypothetical protein